MQEGMKSDKFSRLREFAESQLENEQQDNNAFSALEFSELVHELQVYQIELEHQNDELRNAQEELQKINSLYTDLYEFAPVGYVTVNSRGYVLQINTTGSSLLGSEKKYIINQQFIRYIGNSINIDTYLSFIKSVMNSNNLQSTELQLKRSNGIYFYAKIEGIRIQNDDGKFVARLTFSDITLKKEAEAKFRVMTEQSLMAILISSTGKIEYYNEKFLQLSEYSHLDVQSWKPYQFLDLVHPDDRKKAHEQLLKKESGDSRKIDHHYEVKGITKSGRILWLELFSKSIPFHDGFADLITLIDITERVNAVDKIKKSEEILITIFDEMEASVYVCDLVNYELLYVNKYFESIYGKNVKGKKCWEIIKEKEFGPCEFCTNEKLIDQEGDPTEGYEWEFHNKTTNKWFSVHDRAIQWIDGRLVRLEIAFDITDTKLKQQKINEYAEELKKINANKDKLFSIISHDLRSPFNGFLGFAEYLATNASMIKQDELEITAQKMFESAKYTYNLIENLLEWSRLQTGGIKIQKVNFDLTHLIDNVIELSRPNAQKKGISCSNHIHQGTYIIADPNLINTIIRNLINNAIKFTNNGGFVNVFAQKSLNEIKVTVSDNGIGIEPYRLNSIFDSQESTTSHGTNNEKGTGLGLILCREFIELHEGKIKAEINEDGGTSFIFTLPLQ